MGIEKVVLNDRSHEAIELIRRNADRNKLSELVEVCNEDANVLLWRYRPRFHVIDLDPFGSPAPFIDAACSALARNGMLMITATDTAPLCGAYPKACLRKYGARSLRTEYCHELGTRILVGFCQRVGGGHDFALIPVLAYSTEHYIRIYLRAKSGAKRADEVLAKQGYVSHCVACGRRVLTFGITAKLPAECECGEKLEHAGPAWLGSLMDRGFIQLIISDLASRNFRLGQRALVLLNRCVGEAGGPPMFYDVHEVAKRAGLSPPKLSEIIARLRENGYFASRTHFSGTGLRTDAPIAELLRAIG
jgi:tRNA (guanine26-N2/guanine27-N2)-dimethyltransferase